MGWNRFCLEGGWRGEVAQTMYTHVSKCKNDKIKEGKKKSEYGWCTFCTRMNVEYLNLFKSPEEGD
jgi:hypothetical protein